jgi:hypothetical protein
MFIYPSLADPEFVRDIALNTGMPPRSILDRHDWTFFQAYAWLSYDGSNRFQSDYYWKLLVPPAVGASAFMLIGLQMIMSGTRKKETRFLSRIT